MSLTSSDRRLVGQRLAGQRLARVSIVAVVSSALVLVGSGTANAAATAVDLGNAESFVVLAYAGVTNTGSTTLGGDIGSAPTTSITGLGSITLVNGGVDQSGQTVTTEAQTDLVAAYNNASGQTPDSLGGVELGGLTLEPGVYSTGGVIELTGNLTLDGNGDPNAVFIFQSASTLLATTDSTVTFIDGATACNVYWRVPSSAEIQANSQFKGTILAQTTIAFGEGAELVGRALTRTGQVTLLGNTITAPECAPSGGTTITPVGGVQTGDGSTAGAAGGVDSTFVAAGAVSLLAAVGVVYAVLTRRRLRTV